MSIQLCLLHHVPGVGVLDGDVGVVVHPLEEDEEDEVAEDEDQEDELRDELEEDFGDLSVVQLVPEAQTDTTDLKI